MTETRMGYWRAFPFLLLGLAVATLGLLWLRVLYHGFMGFTPNMHPGIAFYFFPLIFAAAAVCAIPLEYLQRKLDYIPRNGFEATAIGTAYGSVLLAEWAFPPHWWLILVLNPLTLRWLVCVGLRKRIKAAPSSDA